MQSRYAIIYVEDAKVAVKHQRPARARDTQSIPTIACIPGSGNRSGQARNPLDSGPYCLFRTAH